ncbi:MAG: helix-turn-helix domain-containing protein [Agathobaculum sp.]|jgi:transcriptional regulator with XRE-family HTH domain|uniref:helix-turn-helix domain-containing protein n=1 Tax=Agathobaculum sp. TaxID=2048138 RepID=UPI003D8A2572
MDFAHSDRYRKLGLNIQYYRKERSFSQERLAECAGISVSLLAKAENAFAGISLDTLFRIADALEVEPYKLLKFRD